MLTGKWTPMNVAVMKFNQLYEETLAHSGENDENHMVRVLQLYETIVGGRKHMNRIESICNEEGVRFYGNDVPTQFVDHFQRFLGVESNTQSMDGMSDMFTTKLSREEANAMICPISDMKIKQMFDIDDDKAPGPDGFISCFFKKAWNIIGSDICDAVREFFISG
ncbi:hypothetical protein Tco_0172729, partial [Tanacetum coccineum]